MSYTIDTIQYKGHTIELQQDDDAESPREWDNVGEILYTSSRYNLGDRRTTREEIEEIVKRDDVIWLPVYAYIHSGTRLNTTSFHCPWDSGQCGIIWCTKERAVKECGKTRCTKKVIAQVEKYMAGEVETLDQFFNGEVVGYVVEGPLCNDSCGGFFPDAGEYSKRYDYAISEAKANIDYARKQRAAELKAERLEKRLAKEQHLALI